jgi:hypothetical protein
MMAHELKPKEKAIELLQRMERAINETTIGGITLEAKLAATVAVADLIEEHNYKSPIGWNIKRTKYWEAVLSEISSYRTD